MLLDILYNTDYLIQCVCWKLAQRVVCARSAKIRQLVYCKLPMPVRHVGVATLVAFLALRK